MLFLLPVEALAEYWVSIASHENRDHAEAQWRAASERSPHPFVVIGTASEEGFYFRVAAGPIQRMAEARAVLADVKADGFSEAWIWRRQDQSSLSFQNSDPSDFKTILVAVAPEGADLTPGGPPADADLAGRISDPQPRLKIFDQSTPIPLDRYSEDQITVTIDGVLDEDMWQRQAGLDEFLVINPETLAEPEYSTLVRAFYTEKGIYISFEMEQPVETLVRRYTGRDDFDTDRDLVGVTLDTSGEGRYGYWVDLALGDNQTDGTVLAERQFSMVWDGAWSGATHVTDKGWNAELIIPWSQVAMPKQSGDRLINVSFSRRLAARGERWTMPPLPWNQPLYMSALQPVSLSRVDPIQQWSVFPFISATADAVRDAETTDMGADIFWRPSTNFQATAAVKPDFGGVESDDVIVNLGAFETFFPEKRIFFKEGIEAFSATPRADDWNPTTLLNTRRIGGRGRAPALPDGVEIDDLQRQQPVQLAGALKTVGTIGPVRYGLLGAMEEDAAYEADGRRYIQDGTDYGVGRLLYEQKPSDGGYRAIGVLSALSRHPEENTQAHGLDYHYLTASGGWKVDGQMLYSNTVDEGDGFGGFVDVERSFGDGQLFDVGLAHYDANLDLNDLGFLRRNDVTTLELDYEVQRAGTKRFRKWERRHGFDLQRNGAGEITRRRLSTKMSLDLVSLNDLDFRVSYEPARLDDRSSRGNGSFRVDPRARIGTGFKTDSSRSLSAGLGLSYSTENLDGHDTELKGGVTWRPVDNLQFKANVSHQIREAWLLWQEDNNFATYRAREWSAKVGIDFYPSAKQQFRIAAQWVGIKAKRQRNYQLLEQGGSLSEVGDDVALSEDFSISNISLQFRYRWEIAPLSELFVVYTLNGEGYVERGAFSEVLDDAFSDPIGEQLVVKLRYRFGS